MAINRKPFEKWITENTKLAADRAAEVHAQQAELEQIRASIESDADAIRDAIASGDQSAYEKSVTVKAFHSARLTILEHNNAASKVLPSDADLDDLMCSVYAEYKRQRDTVLAEILPKMDEAAAALAELEQMRATALAPLLTLVDAGHRWMHERRFMGGNAAHELAASADELKRFIK